MENLELTSSHRHTKITTIYIENRDFPLVTQVVKNLPAMQGTWVQSLDQEVS